MRKFFIIPGMLAVILLASCSKELEQYDGQVFGENAAYQNTDHVQLGINGAYGGLSNFFSDMYKSALVSDEGRLGFDNAGQGALTYRYQYNSDATSGGDVIAGYASFYGLIDQVNRVLPHVYTAENSITSPVTQAQRQAMEGQLLALRAFSHFIILRNFAGNYDPSAPGIAIVTASDPSSRPSRSTIGEVITQIETDLTAAKGLLPAVTVASFNDNLINKINVAAIQAWVARYKKDWASVITYTSEVISSGVKTLATGSTYAGIWTDANKAERLLTVFIPTSTAVGSPWTTSSGVIYVAPSDKLRSVYDINDIRMASFIGQDSRGEYYVNKHFVSSKGPRILDLKIIRLSDMYLMRAEAYARSVSPNITAGASDLNTIRTNRITGYVNESFASAAALANAVMDERFKELCFEGQRFYDLKLHGLPVQRNASDASPQWQTLPSDSHLFVFPIPQSALLANPNMEQNSGY